MYNELVVECTNCRAKVDKDTVEEFLKDMVDYFSESAIETVFSYLEDGSVGVAIVEKGVVLVNYLTSINSVRVSIYYRRPFTIPELDDRLNLYFIPSSIDYKYKG